MPVSFSLLRFAQAVGLTTLLIWCQQALGDDPSKPDTGAEKLVQQLGSRSYAEREAAEPKLLALGVKALPAVREGKKSSDAEVVRRSEELLKKIWATASREIRIHKIGLPGAAGKRFTQIVGDTHTGRMLFALLADDHRRAEVAEEASGDMSKAARLYNAEVRRLNANPDAFTTGDVVLVLFLGADLRTSNDRSELYSLMRQRIGDLSAGAATSEPFVRLFDAWWK